MSAVIHDLRHSTTPSLSPPSSLRRWLSVFVRMIWKELRVLLPFWAVVIIAMNGLSGIVVWALRDELWLGSNSNQSLYALMAIAGLFPLLYAIGFGAMSYANEREEGTWDLLRRISAPSSAVCAAKLLMGLSSALLMMSLAWWGMRFYVPASISIKHSEMRLEHGMLVVAGVVCLSQAASLLTKSVLWALGLATSFSLPMAVIVVSIVESRGAASARPDDEIQGAFWVIVVGAVGLVVMQFWLAQRWMLNLSPWSVTPVRWPLKLIRLLRNPVCDVGPWENSPVEWQRQLGRLIAREWLLARRWLWIAGVTLVAATLMLFVEPSRQFQELISEFGLLVVSLFPVFCGVWAYQYDQREQRYRFLADRGVPPGLAWLSKHIVRLSVVATAVLSLFVSMAPIFILHRPMHFPFDLASYLTIFAFTSYSVGQLFGQLIRSPIVASFLACLFAGLLFAWTICVEQLHVPIVFEFTPAVILLAASYLRSRDWMEDRRSVSAWSRLVASVLLPFALLYGSIGLYRMSGVPQLDQAMLAKSLARPLQARFQSALRNGQSRYSMITEVFGNERAAMLREIATIISATKDISATKEQSLHRPIDPDRPNFDSVIPNEKFISEIELLMQQGYLEHHHAGLVSLLAERAGSVRWPLTESLLRELHARHFAETRQLFRAATRDPNLIWPQELFQSWNGRHEFKPFSYLLALSADEAARAGRWDEAIEDSLCLWRFGRQIMRQPPQYEWTLFNHATRLAADQLTYIAEKCRSPELIRRIIRELMTVSSAWPSSTDDVHEQWASWDQTTLESNVISTAHRQGMQSRNFGITATFLGRVFPWEFSRSRRELNGLFAARMAIWEALDAVVQDGHADRVRLIPPSPLPPSSPATTESNANILATQPNVLMPEERLLQQTRPLFQQSLFLSYSDKASPPINNILSREVGHRMLILQLAVIAWQHEHGGLPDRLEDLAGTHLDRLPLDPLSGTPYLLVRTLEELKQLMPAANRSTQRDEYYKTLIPGIFAPSSGMEVFGLRVVRPDGRGDVWLEFDQPSGTVWGRAISSPKE